MDMTEQSPNRLRKIEKIRAEKKIIGKYFYFTANT